MKNSKNFGLVTFRWTVLISLLFLTGCASIYVDNSTKEIPSSDYKQPRSIEPVQIVFEFQTDGKSNDLATNYIKDRVLEQVKQSGLFSDVSEKPVDGGALLSIILNNVPITDDAFSKGFVTGLTFGLAGSEVTDGYICIISYSDDNSNSVIEKRARHAIHTTLGNSSAPENATKVDNLDEAVYLMTRQIVSNVLNDLSHDPEFR